MFYNLFIPWPHEVFEFYVLKHKLLECYFLKLIGGVGELPGAIRKDIRLNDGGIKGTVEEKLYDVLYYVLALANVYDINLEKYIQLKRRLILGGEEMNDWFTVEKINYDTYVISEYRHWEETHCYLLIGAEKALLIDTGLGVSMSKNCC